MSKFTMHIIVPAKAIGTIIDLLDNEGILVSVEPFKGENGPRYHTKPRTTVYHSSRGDTGRNMVILALLESPKSYDHLVGLFEKAGRKKNSASPVTSVLKKDGMATSNNHIWSLTDKGRREALSISKGVQK